MKLQFVILCAPGRSGSTLLQGILNSSPETVIRGENFNVLYGIFKAFTSLKKLQDLTNQFPHSLDSTHPFYGGNNIDIETFIVQARELFVAQLCPDIYTRVIGFKEVRWMRCDLKDDFEDYIAFIKRLLPMVRFVILTRDIEEIIASRERVGFSTTGEIHSRESVILDITEFYEKSSILGSSMFKIDYRDLSKFDKISELASFLDISISKEIWVEKLKLSHSYGGISKFD